MRGEEFVKRLLPQKEEPGEKLRSSLAKMSKGEIQLMLVQLEEEMRAAAETLEFERAAQIRDQIFELKEKVRR